MPAKIIDGKQIAQKIKSEIFNEINEIKKTGKVPGLAVILIGSDPASGVYVKNKSLDCEEVGIVSFEYRLPETVTESEVLDLIRQLNIDDKVHGILVQLPLPKHLNEKKVIELIDYRKDVDCFHPINVGKLVIGDDDCFFPCTPYGCKVLINSVMPDTAGKHLVVVGRSNIVGKPMANLMVQKRKDANCIVTICHSAASDLKKYTLSADILVAAIGSPQFIKGDMIKDGAIVIDVGMNRIVTAEGKTKLVGDVDFDEAVKKASSITPVPGGVGPMTRAILLKNTLKSFKAHNQI